MNEIQLKRKFVEDKNYQLTKREMGSLVQFHTSYLLANHKQELDSSPVTFLDGTPFLSGYDRIVIGAHGPYIEFDEEHILDSIDFVVPEGQEWRQNTIKVKYWWFTPVGRCDKVYYQVDKVKYADYKVGKYYIDFYSIRKGIDHGNTIKQKS